MIFIEIMIFYISIKLHIDIYAYTYSFYAGSFGIKFESKEGTFY